MAIKFDNVEALLIDESFQNWYFKSDQKEAASWEKRMAEDPDLKSLIAQAVNLLDRTRLKENKPTEADVLAAESRLMNRLGNTENKTKVHHLLRRRILWAAAAVLFLIVSAVAVNSYFGNTMSDFKTEFGEIKKHQLPDGSVITMNANSNLSYPARWTNLTDREVWIDGEAFFEVKTTEKKNRFIVHTGSFDVIVTGTSFNVHNRNSNKNVFLKEGSVLIRSDEGNQEQLNPGEYIEYADNGKLQRKIQTNSQSTAWMDKKFVFEKTPLRDIASAVKEIYGINVTIEDKLTGDQLITGILPNDNLDIFLQSLEATGKFRIERNDHQILFRSSK